MQNGMALNKIHSKRHAPVESAFRCVCPLWVTSRDCTEKLRDRLAAVSGSGLTVRPLTQLSTRSNSTHIDSSDDRGNSLRIDSAGNTRIRSMRDDIRHKDSHSRTRKARSRSRSSTDRNSRNSHGSTERSQRRLVTRFRAPPRTRPTPPPNRPISLPPIPLSYSRVRPQSQQRIQIFGTLHTYFTSLSRDLFEDR